MGDDRTGTDGTVIADGDWFGPFLACGTFDNPYHHLPSMASYLDMSDKEVWELEDEDYDEEVIFVSKIY